MKLYDYPLSSAAYRVRIALNLKGLEFERVPVDLLANEQTSDPYREVNPQALVPALETPGGVITQSLAIIEYLEETCPEPPLLPSDAVARAEQRALAAIIACEVHPLGNLRVRRYLEGTLARSESETRDWIAHWMRLGFAALEACVPTPTPPYLGGAQPMIADLFLAPQMFNARRYGVALDDFPKLGAITERLDSLDAFARAAPGAVP